MRLLFYRKEDPDYAEVDETVEYDDGETIQFESGDVVNVEFDELGIATFYTDQGHWYFTMKPEEIEMIFKAMINEITGRRVT